MLVFINLTHVSVCYSCHGFVAHKSSVDLCET